MKENKIQPVTVIGRNGETLLKTSVGKVRDLDTGLEKFFDANDLKHMAMLARQFIAFGDGNVTHLVNLNSVSVITFVNPDVKPTKKK